MPEIRSNLCKRFENEPPFVKSRVGDDKTGRIIDLFLSVKECLHNIVKHAGAKKVMISIKTDNKFALIIADDGKGFDQILHQSGNGLLNMKERAESLKGKLSLFNTAGTTIELEIPI